MIAKVDCTVAKDTCSEAGVSICANNSWAQSLTALEIGARPMIRNPENKKILTLGSLTLTSTMIPTG